MIPAEPLFRVHLRVGVRLALRAAAPTVGLPIVALLVQQNPSNATMGLAAWLLAPPGEAASGLCIAIVALVLASWAVRRITRGIGGWLRHLPASEVTHRRSALAALVAAQSPLLVCALLLAPLAGYRAGVIVLARLAALLVAMTGAALAVWPGTHRWRSRPLALLAMVAAASGHLAALLAAVALLVLSERLAGPVALRGRVARRRAWRKAPVPMLIGARALGASVFEAPALALIPVAAMVALRLNNQHLSAAVAAGAARLGGGLGGRGDHRGHERASGSTRLLAESALLACWVALLPWLAVGALAVAPVTRMSSAKEDRRQKVSRWEERHHAVTGDPQAWSAR